MKFKIGNIIKAANPLSVINNDESHSNAKSGEIFFLIEQLKTDNFLIIQQKTLKTSVWSEEDLETNFIAIVNQVQKKTRKKKS